MQFGISIFCKGVAREASGAIAPPELEKREKYCEKDDKKNEIFSLAASKLKKKNFWRLPYFSPPP